MLHPKTYLTPDEWTLITRFWRSARGFWSEWAARWLVILLIVTVFLQLFIQYRINFWNRDFFDAIERKDARELLAQALTFLPLAGASLTLAIVSVWGRMTTQRKWRVWLTSHLYDYWLSGGHPYRLQFMPGEHENPEFRIAEDARLATDMPVDLTLGLLTSCLTAITFIGVLWSVGGGLEINAFGLNLAIPGYLVVAVIVYSMLMTGAMMLIARRLTHVMENNKRAEAELRAVGTHLREVGEIASTIDGNRDGRRMMNMALAEVVQAWLAYCWQLMRTTLVSHTNTLLTPFVALLLCTPKFMNGMMTLGEVVQAAAAFAIVQSAFNWITDSYSGIAEWMSSTNRVASLLIALDEIDGPGQETAPTQASDLAEAPITARRDPAGAG